MPNQAVTTTAMLLLIQFIIIVLGWETVFLTESKKGNLALTTFVVVLASSILSVMIYHSRLRSPDGEILYVGAQTAAGLALNANVKLKRVGKVIIIIGVALAGGTVMTGLFQLLFPTF